MNQVMDFTEIITFLKNYFLFNYKIIKIDNYKIEHQPYRKWNEINYKTEFSINQISINKIK